MGRQQLLLGAEMKPFCLVSSLSLTLRKEGPGIKKKGKGFQTGSSLFSFSVIYFFELFSSWVLWHPLQMLCNVKAGILVLFFVFFSAGRSIFLNFFQLPTKRVNLSSCIKRRCVTTPTQPLQRDGWPSDHPHLGTVWQKTQTLQRRLRWRTTCSEASVTKGDRELLLRTLWRW